METAKNAKNGLKIAQSRKGISVQKNAGVISMEITLQRLKQSPAGEETIGNLYINDVSQCVILEDQFRTEKVQGDTRIPAGRYKILLRKAGRIHENYAKKFGKWHRGTLWLQDVPGFQYILIHIGNTEADTMGCLLTGTSYGLDAGHFVVSGSTAAYQKIYTVIADAIEQGECWITIHDEI